MEMGRFWSLHRWTLWLLFASYACAFYIPGQLANPESTFVTNHLFRAMQDILSSGTMTTSRFLSSSTKSSPTIRNCNTLTMICPLSAPLVGVRTAARPSARAKVCR